MELGDIYGPEYHRGIREAYSKSRKEYGHISAVEYVHRIVTELFHPKSVIDIGSSCGVFLLPFYEAGVDIWGVDGDESAFQPDIRCVPIEFLEGHDLRKPYYPPKRYDVCICTETLEHIPPEYADVVLDSLSRCSDNLFFMAAVPGQGGIGHVNLLPPKEWAERLRVRGFRQWQKRRLPERVRDWPTLLVMSKRWRKGD